MDTPGKGKKKKGRNRNKLLQRQRRYRQRKQAAVGGIEEVRARYCQRYYVQIAHLKAAGQYEAFKTKTSKKGVRRYHTTPAEKREELKRRILMLQKAWRERMIREGAYEEFRGRLNARRRHQMAEK